MNDLNGDDLAKIGITGGGVAGILYALVKWLGGRNIEALDKAIGSLSAAVASLTGEVQKLRESNIALAKDVGALQEGQRGLIQRADGQAEHWRRQFEEYRAVVHERLDKATRDMISTVETMAEKGRRK